MSSAVLEELSQGLSPDEKKELLGKIQASLNLSLKDTDGIVNKSEPPEELRQRMTAEIAKLSFFQKFFLRIRGFFTNRSLPDVLIEKKLADARFVLRNRIPSSIQLTRETLTAEMGQRIYDFFAEASVLKPVFDHLFQQKLTLETGLLHLLEAEYPQALHRLTDIFSLDEMEVFYRQDQKRAPLYVQMRKKLEAYFKQFPADVIERTREKLKPLYYLKALVQFPYAFLFDLFGHNPGKMEIQKYPFFTEAASQRCAGFLERLYYGIYLTQKLNWQEGSLNYLFMGIKDKLSLEEINHHISSLIRLGQDASEDVPWRELLQWCFHDPFYTVKFYLPKFSIRDFYQTVLEIRFHEELDKTIPHVRQRITEAEKSFLFQSPMMQTMEHYAAGIAPSAAALRIRGYQFPETMNLLLSFLNQHFMRKIFPFIQSLTRMISQGNKGFLQPLVNSADELVSLRDKVLKFDKSLHPESEDGKDFQKLKFELNNKATSQKPFILLIQKKDAEAKELYELVVEQLQLLAAQLDGLLQKNIPLLNAVLKLPYLLEGPTDTIEMVLERSSIVVKKGLFVLQESYALES